jgi:hypothetical protein
MQRKMTIKQPKKKKSQVYKKKKKNTKNERNEWFGKLEWPPEFIEKLKI